MTKERSSSSDTIILSSVSDFLLVINSKEISSIIKGIHFVLCDDPHQLLLAKYVAANPTLSHILSRLLPSLLQFSDHEYMAAVMFLLDACFHHLGRAPELAKLIINEQLKPLYRCLSSGNVHCLTGVLLVLTRLASEAGDLLVHHFDLSHKGLQEAARMRRSLGGSWGTQRSPRQAFLHFLIKLLTSTDYESRVLLSKSAFLLAYVTGKGLDKDGPREIGLLLQAVLDRIVFNEENNRNLAVAFFKNHQLNKIAALLSTGKDEQVKAEVEAFLIHCFGRADKGLTYPSATLGVLRNRLLLDVLLDLDPLHEERHQLIAQKTLSACPDAAWAYLSLSQASGAGRRPHFDPQATVDFALSVNLAIKLIQVLPAPLSEDTLVPKTITRSLLTRGVSHVDGSVRLSSLMLLLALLQRFARGLPQDLLPAAREILPDYRTLYNGWRTNVLRDEEGVFLEHCYLEATRLYASALKLGDFVVTDMVRAADIWKLPTVNEQQMQQCREQLAPVAIQLLTVLDPTALLADHPALGILGDLVKAGQDSCPPELARWLEEWVLKIGFTREERYARFLCKEIHFQARILQALFDLIHVPLTFPRDADPALTYFSLDPSAVPSSAEFEPRPVQTAMAVEPVAPPPVVDAPATVDPSSYKDTLTATDAISLMNSACASARRRALFASYATILPDAQLVMPNSYEQLIDMLLGRYDCPTWLSLMAKALADGDERQPMDLRLLVECGALGLAIIGLSLTDIGLRRLSHLILTRYTDSITRSRVRERRQLALVLSSLSAHASPDEPLAPMSRPVAYLHALALPVMLRPEHALYRPLNELFLSFPAVSPAEASRRLLFDANEGWQRAVHWALLWLEATVGQGGRAADACQVYELHIPENVAILLMGAGLESATRDLARKLLTSLAGGGAPPWLSATLDFLERHEAPRW